MENKETPRHNYSTSRLVTCRVLSISLRKKERPAFRNTCRSAPPACAAHTAFYGIGTDFKLVLFHKLMLLDCMLLRNAANMRSE